MNGFDDFPLEGYEAQKITGHLYMRGFKTGDYSDINLYWGELFRPRTTHCSFENSDGREQVKTA